MTTETRDAERFGLAIHAAKRIGGPWGPPCTDEGGRELPYGTDSDIPFGYGCDCRSMATHLIELIAEQHKATCVQKCPLAGDDSAVCPETHSCWCADDPPKETRSGGSVEELRVFEVHGEVFTSYLPPMVTYGLVSSRSAEMERLGYDSVTVNTFGNTWTRTSPPSKSSTPPHET